MLLTNIYLYFISEKASKLEIQIINKHLFFGTNLSTHLTETNYLILSRSLTDLILNLSKKFMQIPWYDLRRAPRSILSSMTVTGTTKIRVHSQFTLIPMKVLGNWLMFTFFYIAIPLDSQMRRQNGKGFETLKKKSTHFVIRPTAIKGDQILDSAC